MLILKINIKSYTHLTDIIDRNNTFGLSFNVCLVGNVNLTSYFFII